MKKIFQTAGLNIELTILKESCFVFITEAKGLEINTWRIGIQTPYDTLPTVINLDEGIGSNEIVDNMVKSMTKRLGIPVLASVNVPN